jgi:hypothetical protein
MKIDTNIPPPVINYQKIATELIQTLQPGESTLLDKNDGDKIRNAFASVLYKKKIKDKKFVTRFDRNFGAIRVWRIS